MSYYKHLFSTIWEIHRLYIKLEIRWRKPHM